MEMASRHVLLFLLTFLFHASSLYLGDYDRPKLRTLAEEKNGNLSDLGPINKKSDLSDQSRRVKENEKQSLPLRTGTYINCVFNTGSINQPDYDCKYSPDVNVNWTNTDGRLIGTMSTSFGCGKRRSVRNKMQSPQNEVGSRTWKQLIRDKRRTVYRDDAEAEEALAEAENAPIEEAQQIEEEENVVPEVNQYVTEDLEDTPYEDDKRSPSETIKDDDNEYKGLINAQISASFKSGEGAEEEEDNEVQEEVEDEADTGDAEEPAEEGEAEVEEGGPADKEDPVEEESEEGMGDQTEESVEKEEGENDEGDLEGDDEGDDGGDDKGDDGGDDGGDDEGDDDENGEKPKVESEAGGTKRVDVESILVPIQQEIEALLSESEMPLFMDFILELLYELGDYLISLLIRNLQERLRQGRISEKFDRKVEMLSQSYGNDTVKAMEVMEKKIHEQLGKSYQLKIGEFLNQLYKVWKL